MVLFEKYSYLAAPDGKDLPGKLLGFTKLSGPVSLVCGLYDALMVSHLHKPLDVAMRTARYVVPTLSISIVAPGVIYAATNMRGRDDVFNYILGALSTLPILKASLNLPPGLVCMAGLTTVTLFLIVKSRLRHPTPLVRSALKHGSYI